MLLFPGIASEEVPGTIRQLTSVGNHKNAAPGMAAAEMRARPLW
jgi:hypothetical protein